MGCLEAVGCDNGTAWRCLSRIGCALAAAAAAAAAGLPHPNMLAKQLIEGVGCFVGRWLVVV